MKVDLMTAYPIYKSVMDNASFVYYNTETRALTFECNETVDFSCVWDPCVSGSHDALIRYYRQTLEEMFPSAGIKINAGY